MDNKRPKSRFQSTLPRRERLPATPKLEHFRYFNPRSREGSDRVAISSFVYLLYFNPRSREGSDYVGGFMITLYSDFNPRSREGSDEYPTNFLFHLFQFQSTLPRRERHNFFSDLSAMILISIHAPAKGATTVWLYCMSIPRYFNPRSREGSDTRPERPHKESGRFQSTLPRRERLALFVASVMFLLFQSTLPRRERPFAAIVEVI